MDVKKHYEGIKAKIIENDVCLEKGKLNIGTYCVDMLILPLCLQ